MDNARSLERQSLYSMNDSLKQWAEHCVAANSLLTGFKIAATKSKPSKGSLAKILAMYKKHQQEIINNMEMFIDELK